MATETGTPATTMPGDGRVGAALGGIRVKGKREPVEAWRLDGA